MYSIINYELHFHIRNTYCGTINYQKYYYYQVVISCTSIIEVHEIHNAIILLAQANPLVSWVTRLAITPMI